MLIVYKNKYPDKFILKLATSNKGIITNSNSAHFTCSGKYIAWLGGDDLMFKDKILTQVIYMEANNDCAICYHDLNVFDSDTDKVVYKYSKVNKPREGYANIASKFGIFNGASSSMFRRSDTPLQGFNELIPVASDWLYWIKH